MTGSRSFQDDEPIHHHQEDGMPPTDFQQQHQQEDPLGGSFANNQDEQEIAVVQEQHQQQKAHSDYCDRRLSRAARSLLHRHLMAISSVKNKNDASSSSVWELLQDSLSSSSSSSLKNCPLIPTRDIFRYQEEAGTVMLLPPPKKTNTRLGLSTRSALYQQTKRNWLETPLWRCGFDGKIFTSRYYLDQHLNKYYSHKIIAEAEALLHNNNNNKNNDEPYYICPATAWCPALGGMGMCSQHALELEPYYGPGSNGLKRHDPISLEAHRQLASFHEGEAGEGCNESVMAQSQKLCYQMIQDCFGDSSEEETRLYLETSLCGRINCPDRLHQLFFAATTRSNDAVSLMKKQVHEWQDEWDDYYREHHTTSRFSIFVVVLVLGLYYFKYINKAIFWNSTSPTTNALLQKNKKRKDHLKGSRLIVQKRGGGGGISGLWKTTKKTILGFVVNTINNPTSKKNKKKKKNKAKEQ